MQTKHKTLENLLTEIKNLSLHKIYDVRLQEKDCIFEKDLYGDFICPICLNFVDNPYCCKLCNALYCKICINNNSNIQSCPNCRETLEIIQIQRINKNTLNALKFSCPFRCGKVFKFEDKDNHFSECFNRKLIPIKCGLCEVKLTYTDSNENLIQHAKVCEKVIFNCLFCNEKINKMDFLEHLRECKLMEMPCTHCKIGFLQRFQKAHYAFYCEKLSKFYNTLKNLIK